MIDKSVIQWGVLIFNTGVLVFSIYTAVYTRRAYAKIRKLTQEK